MASAAPPLVNSSNHGSDERYWPSKIRRTDPPPSAMILPTRPAQSRSMLQHPAARTAITDCAASATMERASKPFDQRASNIHPAPRYSAAQSCLGCMKPLGASRIQANGSLVNRKDHRRPRRVVFVVADDFTGKGFKQTSCPSPLRLLTSLPRRSRPSSRSERAGNSCRHLTVKPQENLTEFHRPARRFRCCSWGAISGLQVLDRMP